jgi:hypothetical protein
MRRYGFRFLAAILTFGLGVALSLVFGLFRVPATKFVHTEWRETSCPKRLRVLGTVPIVDSQFGDPLKLEYVGKMDGRDVRFRVRLENRTGRTITSYAISGQENWDANGRRGVRFQDWNSSEVLVPGESRVLTLARADEGLSLRVDTVNFEDGSVWINPRAPR